MFKAERRLRVPKIHVTLRKAFGFGSTTMAHNPFDGQTLHFSFPVLTMSAMPARPGGESAKLDAETQARVEREQKAGPWRMARRHGHGRRDRPARAPQRAAPGSRARARTTRRLVAGAAPLVAAHARAEAPAQVLLEACDGGADELLAQRRERG